MSKCRFVFQSLALILLIAAVPGTNYSQSNTDCLECHLDHEMTAVNYNGDIVNVFVDTTSFNNSVHGRAELDCIACHSDIEELPHKELLAPADCAACHDAINEEYQNSLHGYALQRDNKNAPRCFNCHGKHDILETRNVHSHTNYINIANTCGKCHNEYGLKKDPDIRIARSVEIYLGSVHGRNLARGIAAAAACNDCHGTHTLKGAADPDSWVNKRKIPQTCSKCHSNVYDDYINSIHGKALVAGITDTPVCTDCHGEHSIMSNLNPESPTFKKELAEKVCADCHEDPRITNKYNLPTGTLKTYQDSYHGLANVRGSKQSATCVSCHNAHFILPASNPQSTISPGNVAQTCQKCHDNATLKFAQSYTHEALRESTNSVEHFVKNIYIYLIVLVIGGMIIHNVIIMSKYVREKYHFGKNYPTIRRFDNHILAQHILTTISFIVLVLTGFGLKFPSASWNWIFVQIGMTEEIRGIVHRCAAVLLLGTGFYHMIYLFITRNGKEELSYLVPRFQDLKDLKNNILYHIGKKEKEPEYDKFDYSEKGEYWALIWGTLIMGVTGFILWFPIFFSKFLPSWAITVSETIHYYEAWLATLAIIVWHFFFVILHPEEYPVSLTWITGKITVMEAKKRHSKCYNRLVETGKLETKLDGDPDAVDKKP